MKYVDGPNRPNTRPSKVQVYTSTDDESSGADNSISQPENEMKAKSLDQEVVSNVGGNDQRSDKPPMKKKRKCSKVHYEVNCSEFGELNIAAFVRTCFNLSNLFLFLIFSCFR